MLAPARAHMDAVILMLPAPLLPNRIAVEKSISFIYCAQYIDDV